jgi:hypothetical protein
LNIRCIPCGIGRRIDNAGLQSDGVAEKFCLLRMEMRPDTNKH